jgi:hypothetical protein
VDSAVALCAHLASDALAALPVEPDDVLEWQDGPIAAVVRCSECGGAGLIELLDWSEGGRLRVYSLAGIAPAAVALWRRNLARGSCDLARRERELEALVASAGPVQRLVARDASSGAVRRSAPWPAARPAPEGAWQTRVTAREDGGWLATLGFARDPR